MSKSNRATPPLIDSRMYFLSADQTCENVMRLSVVMSVKVTGSSALAGTIDR